MEPSAQTHNPEQLPPCASKPATEVLLEQYGGSPQLDQASFDARKVVLERQSLHRPEPDPSMRTLKIEAEGDFWRGHTKPKIRLMGRWLEQAGFSPGYRVQVTCVAPGVIELRAPDAATVDGMKPALAGPNKNPF